MSMKRMANDFRTVTPIKLMALTLVAGPQEILGAGREGYCPYRVPEEWRTGRVAPRLDRTALQRVEIVPSLTPVF
jgi:hypothetical protein